MMRLSDNYQRTVDQTVNDITHYRAIVNSVFGSPFTYEHRTSSLIKLDNVPILTITFHLSVLEPIKNDEIDYATGYLLIANLNKLAKMLLEIRYSGLSIEPRRISDTYRYGSGYLNILVDIPRLMNLVKESIFDEFALE